MTDELEKALERARQAGAYDSSGAFTLDGLRADRLLSRYRLPDPQMAVLKLVQSAVASGAREVRIRSRPALSVEHDGRELGRGGLERLLSPASALSGPDRPLGHLAVGLHAALVRHPGCVEIDSGSVRLRLFGDRHEWSPTAPGNRIAVHGLDYDARGYGGLVRTLLLDFFGLFAGRSTPDEYVRSRCAYAPILIFLDGRPVNGGDLARVRGDAVDVIARLRPVEPARFQPHPYTTPPVDRPGLGVPRWGGLWERFLVAPAPSGDRPPGRTFRTGDQKWLAAPWFPCELEECTLLEPAELPAQAGRVLLDGQLGVPCFAIGRCQDLGVPYGIHWMKDGVVVEHEPRVPDGCPAYSQFIASAEALKLDASGFRLVRDESYERAVSLLQKLARAE